MLLSLSWVWILSSRSELLPILIGPHLPIDRSLNLSSWFNITLSTSSRSLSKFWFGIKVSIFWESTLIVEYFFCESSYYFLSFYSLLYSLFLSSSSVYFPVILVCNYYLCNRLYIGSLVSLLFEANTYDILFILGFLECLDLLSGVCWTWEWKFTAFAFFGL